ASGSSSFPCWPSSSGSACIRCPSPGRRRRACALSSPRSRPRRRPPWLSPCRDESPRHVMMDIIPVPVISLRVICPAAVLAVTGFLLMLLDLLPPRGRREHMAFVGLGGVVIALIAAVLLWGSDTTGFQGMAILDNLTLFGTLVIGYATGLVLLQSIDYIKRRSMESGEFYILVLFAAAGLAIMAGGHDPPLGFTRPREGSAAAAPPP